MTLVRVMLYFAAFVVAIAAFVGYVLMNQLAFPAVCGMMVLFVGLLALASDPSNAERVRLSRATMPPAHSNHLPSSDTSYARPTRNESNNSNAVRAHSDVQLSTFTTTSCERTSATRRSDLVANSSSYLLRSRHVRHPADVQTFRVPVESELRRPSLSGSNRVAINSLQTPARTLTTPSRSGLWTDTVVKSQPFRQVLPKFQRLSTGLVLTVRLVYSLSMDCLDLKRNVMYRPV